jgi:hypothetical protein
MTYSIEIIIEFLIKNMVSDSTSSAGKSGKREISKDNLPIK